MDNIINWTNLQEVLTEYAERLRNQYQDNLIMDDKLASGKLLNSVEYLIEKGGNEISVSLKLEDYWKWVENGRGPGKFPPMDKILDWIKVKPVIPDERSGRLPTEKQLAFLIGRKISEEGVEGTNDLQKAVDEITEQYEELIGLAIDADLNDSMDVIMSEFYHSLD